MKAKDALMNQAFDGGLAELARVLEIEEYREKRIEKTLNSIVHVKGRSNVLLNDMFSPMCQAAVVIRRIDGTYLDPCDFESYITQTR